MRRELVALLSLAWVIAVCFAGAIHEHGWKRGARVAAEGVVLGVLMGTPGFFLNYFFGGA